MRYQTRKHGCKCAGVKPFDQWKRWRVSRRSNDAARSSALVCLGCRAMWASKARYVELLPDHKPENRSGLSELDVLARLADGSLVVDVHNATVDSITRKGRTRLNIIARKHPRRDSDTGNVYRFVEICYRGKKRKIALHRLVWIAAHRRLPGDGMDIDHIEPDGPDSIDNLRERPASENRADHR